MSIYGIKWVIHREKESVTLTMIFVIGDASQGLTLIHYQSCFLLSQQSFNVMWTTQENSFMFLATRTLPFSELVI